MNELMIDQVLWCKPGEGICARGTIPEKSEFFQDHFPSFPVLPGILALEMLKQTAEYYLRTVQEPHQAHFFLKQIRATKFHTYLNPGDSWESHLQLVESVGDETHWNAKLLHDGKTAVSAKLILAPSHAHHTSAAS